MNPFAGIACLKCGEETLRLEWRMEAQAMIRPGVVSATEWPYCVCDSCGASSRGKPGQP